MKTKYEYKIEYGEAQLAPYSYGLLRRKMGSDYWETMQTASKSRLKPDYAGSKHEAIKYAKELMAYVKKFPKGRYAWV